MNGILTGAIAMCAITISLFFLRFWKATRDRFFLYFGLAFIVEGVHRIVFGLSALRDDDNALFYLIRLVAYGLILFAVIEKNRRRGSDDR